MLIINAKQGTQVGRFTWDHTETYLKQANIVDAETGRIIGSFEVEHTYEGCRKTYGSTIVQFDAPEGTPQELRYFERINYSTWRPSNLAEIARGHKKEGLAFALENAKRVDVDAYGEDAKERLFEKVLPGIDG